MGPPQAVPPKLTEALLVKLSSVCHPLLLPPSASGFLSLDSGVVFMSSCTYQPSPTHLADPWMRCSDWDNLCAAHRGFLHPFSCSILTRLCEAGRAVILSLSACPKGKRMLGWVLGEMVHFTCIFLKVTQLVGGARSCIPIWVIPQPVLSWLCLSGSLRDQEHGSVGLREAAPRAGTSSKLGELILFLHL